MIALAFLTPPQPPTFKVSCWTKPGLEQRRPLPLSAKTDSPEQGWAVYSLRILHYTWQIQSEIEQGSFKAINTQHVLCCGFPEWLSVTCSAEWVQDITSDKHLKTYTNFTVISSQVSSDFSIVNICHLKFIRKFSNPFRKTGHRENILEVCSFSICLSRNALLFLSK